MNKQKGVTLTSLLIGLLIAMLCILAVLSLYRTVVHTGVDSRKAATHDTQLQSALTTVQMLLQNAGFGLDPSGSHVNIGTISFKNSSNVDVSTTALVWKNAGSSDGTSITCHGIADIAGSGERQLVLLSGSNCTSTSNLSAASWTQESILATLSDFSSDSTNPVQVTFAKSNASCTPYGAGSVDTSVLHPNVTISATTSTKQTVNISVCLLNIVASS
ncbi:hypothetical protein F4V57_08645 [Acinetobacter qingfengensis]|uniref:Uncharacterized protein n=1 Tax=Acinetobacter qingfengensis TaxID=1262585 RepID=A0A1E7R1A0_9GAMM|nr:hypothetical protein [Acinetobacter qingfengensis]KAA8733284.1 hypothetical protein F4V57_08645 [Acinetobacter qingfengensis]OEY93085.1 hypothetical protein BJI46_04915 [Acinetobacter qingfengensis]